MFKYFTDFNVELTSNSECKYKFTLKNQHNANPLKLDQLNILMNSKNSQQQFIRDLID